MTRFVHHLIWTNTVIFCFAHNTLRKEWKEEKKENRMLELHHFFTKDTSCHGMKRMTRWFRWQRRKVVRIRSWRKLYVSPKHGGLLTCWLTSDVDLPLDFYLFISWFFITIVFLIVLHPTRALRSLNW